ncbi:MAG: hypothetical protein ABH952_08065 [Candidatus Omnitrophota bacterium]
MLFNLFSWVFCIGLAILYMFISIMANKWSILLFVDMKEETPLLFQKKPYVYLVARTIFFLVALSIGICLNSAPWYSILFALIIIHIVSRVYGRSRGFDHYRFIFREMAEYETDAQKRSFFEGLSKKTNQQILEMFCRHR